MKSIKILVLLVASFNLSSFAQTSTNADDLGRLRLAVYVPEQVDPMQEQASNMLVNKLEQLIAKNGFGGSTYNERFIITANVIVVNKDLLTTAPPMTALNLEISFYIGDGVEGTKFATETVTAKGVGTNENKAYISAIRTINSNNPKLVAFLEKGKVRIMDYYNSKCDLIIKDAQSLAKQNKAEEAIYKLSSIPDACGECYDKALTAIAPIYKQKIDRDCKMKLAEATAIWNANQDEAAANQAGGILSSIEPSSACFSDVKKLFSKIEKRVVIVDKREWKYILKSQKQDSEMIKAYRDIGVAYGNGQPKTITTNIVGFK